MHLLSYTPRSEWHSAIFRKGAPTRSNDKPERVGGSVADSCSPEREDLSASPSAAPSFVAAPPIPDDEELGGRNVSEVGLLESVLDTVSDTVKTHR